MSDEACASPPSPGVAQTWEKLREYQRIGVNFLVSRECVLLGDEMGLGKTVMTSVALRSLVETNGLKRVLVVCPSALVTNWRNELTEWLVDIEPRVISGGRAEREASYLLPFRVAVASYDQIRLDYRFIVEKVDFDLVIIDEAQRIRNPAAQLTHACQSLRRRASWALTGTPLENKPEDLQSIMTFVKRGALYAGAGVAEAQIALQPYFIRRRKRDVLEDLPPMIDQTIELSLTASQEKSYERIESEIDLTGSSDYLLARITELKKVCNFSEDGSSSSKVDALDLILENAKESNEKVIVFSQYVDSLRKLNGHLDSPIRIYHGGMDSRARDATVRWFREMPGHRVLLMSLHAGSVGLNLPEASFVVLFDRWWNPAVEQQAVERAHRFGRSGTLIVYRFLVQGTIEYRIQEVLREKAVMFNEWMNSDDMGNVDSQRAGILRRIISGPPNGRGDA